MSFNLNPQWLQSINCDQTNPCTLCRHVLHLTKTLGQKYTFCPFSFNVYIIRITMQMINKVRNCLINLFRVVGGSLILCIYIYVCIVCFLQISDSWIEWSTYVYDYWDLNFHNWKCVLINVDVSSLYPNFINFWMCVHRDSFMLDVWML